MTEFFDGLEKGTPFRFRALRNGKPHNWIYCRFAGFSKKGKVKCSYWDATAYRSELHKDEVATCELWDPTITEEMLREPIWISDGDEGYILTEWTFADMVGSQWINRWTQTISTIVRVDWNRFGRLCLYTDDALYMAHTIGTWQDADGNGKWDNYGVYDEIRYDVMTHEERVEWAGKRVERLSAAVRSTNFYGGPPPKANEKLEIAREFYRQLTGHWPERELLNVNLRNGDQLALF